jgi:hypothetical protein
MLIANDEGPRWDWTIMATAHRYAFFVVILTAYCGSSSNITPSTGML